MSGNQTVPKPTPAKPTIDQIESDLASIAINENDALFNGPRATENLGTGANDKLAASSDTASYENAAFYERLEKYVLFKLNLETGDENKNNSSLSLDYLNKDLDTLDKHIGSLKNFIEISKKFLKTNKLESK